METQEHTNQEREQGFTLIELLIAIVVVGVLTAVAIVGIAGLTNNGGSAACQATADAAKAASAVFFANSADKPTPTPAAYPTSFTDLVGPPVLLDIPSGVTNGGTTLTGKGWTLTMTPGTATVAPSFTCPTTPAT